MIVFIPFASWGLAFLILCLFIHSERYWWGLGELIFTLALFQWLGFFSYMAVYEFARVNPQTLVIGAAAYVPVGCLYAFMRWSIFVRKIGAKYKEAKAEFAKKWDIDVGLVPYGLQGAKVGLQPTVEKFMGTPRQVVLDDEWRCPLHVEEGTTKATVPVSYHRGRITAWMGYWPFSLVGWFVGDFLIDVMEVLLERMKGVFQRHADRQFE